MFERVELCRTFGTSIVSHRLPARHVCSNNQYHPCFCGGKEAQARRRKIGRGGRADRAGDLVLFNFCSVAKRILPNHHSCLSGSMPKWKFYNLPPCVTISRLVRRRPNATAISALAYIYTQHGSYNLPFIT